MKKDSEANLGSDSDHKREVKSEHDYELKVHTGDIFFCISSLPMDIMKVLDIHEDHQKGKGIIKNNSYYIYMLVTVCLSMLVSVVSIVLTLYLTWWKKKDERKDDKRVQTLNGAQC